LYWEGGGGAILDAAMHKDSISHALSVYDIQTRLCRMPPAFPKSPMMRLPHRNAPQCLIRTALGVALGVLTSPSLAAEIDFNRDVRPILSNRCLICHGPDEDTREADLRLDKLESAGADRDGNRAVVPGKPKESHLLLRLTAEGDERMPPEENGEPLSKSEAETLRLWIEQGAHYSNHWSYDPPVRRDPPEVANQARVRNAVDQYVLKRLARAQLPMAPEADRHTLIRRLALDLTGIPPTPEQVAQFVEDRDPKAYEKLVTRLLASPAFGERWASMWLDLARYADSAGYANDPPRSIWMYRDWVIKAINNNMPFDQFTIEQLAGDLLENSTPAQQIATAFHRNTLTNSEGGTSDEEFRNVAIIDRVNTTMQVWMGATIRCAQCHNHKYDPLSQKDFFRIYAFFNNTADADRADESPLLRVFSEEQEQQRAKLQEMIDGLKLKLTPPTEVVQQRLADWEKRFKRAKWRSIKPLRVSSSAGADFEIDDEHRVHASGVRADKDTYRLEFAADGQPISALRLEVLPAASDSAKPLPSGGPGRAEGGNFVLSEIVLSAGPGDGQSRRGRFVRIALPGLNRFLHMAEVQVFSGAENLAAKGKAKQSTTGFDGLASLAIDGNTDGDYEAKSVSHTATGDKSPWWELDLGRDADVDRIDIWNRTDNNLQSRLDGFVVSLLDSDRNIVWTQTNAKAPKREHTASLDGLSGVDFVAASQSYAQATSGGNPYAAWHASSSIDRDAKGAKWGWAVGGETGKANAAAFVLDSPIKFDADGKLVVLLKQNYGEGSLLGRFRLSVSSTPRPIYLLPNAVSDALNVVADNRTSIQNKAMLDFYRSIDKPSKALIDEIAAIEKRKAAIKATTTPVMTELAKGKRRTTKIQIRGNFMVTTDVVNEGTPTAFHAYPKNAPMNRLGFARWLVDKKNPLTARVVVNRYWEQIFGVGLVATSEEFGSQGDLPSHPGLLDFLAVELMDRDWDVKQLLRLIVSSSTYRQSSFASPALIERDPENRLLARGPRFRLSAEMVRDQALSVAGLLSKKMHGPSVRPLRPKLGLKAAFGGSTDWETSPGEDRHRRALYTSWRRSLPYPSMATFDAPTRNVCTIRRGRTNTPLQALVTLNDPAYVEAAQALARRMATHTGTDVERAAYGFRLCTSRSPKAAEVEKLTALFHRAVEIFEAAPERAKQLATEPLGPLEGKQVEIGYARLAAWTTVANVLLNLDEMLVKQ
jgi:hypothetical protein